MVWCEPDSLRCSHFIVYSASNLLTQNYFTWTKTNLSGRGLVYIRVLAQGFPNPWSRPDVTSRGASDGSRRPKIMERHWWLIRGPVWAGVSFRWLDQRDLQIRDLNWTCDNGCFNTKICLMWFWPCIVVNMWK